MTRTYDYVIAGGGAAGCVLAARLSEGGAEVLLLEAGYADSHPLIHVPAGFTKLSGPRVNWGYRTVPQKHLNNRDMWYPQGKTLGGGSSINAMIYTRGHRNDYEDWKASGAEGWGYDDVLPYFRKAEDNVRLADEYHGTGGPLRVSDPISPLPITATFIRAAQRAGLPFSHDFNGAEQEGVGYHQTTTRDGRRGSAAVSYLRPARDRKNLTILTRAQALRVIIEKGRAIGVEYHRHGEGVAEARASREVIVTAGAIGSPKLMMLSGLGPAAHLKEHGIAIAADIPGIGENLQDHLDCYTVYDLNGAHSYYGADQYLRQAGWALQYMLYRNGPVTTNIVEAGAFARVDPESRQPDIQLHFLPAYVVDHGMMRIKGYGVSLYSNLLRPRSAGTVRLRSNRPEDHPLIDPNYLADPYDRRMAVEGLKLAREVMAQKDFAPFIARERMPGGDARSDADLAAYVREWAKTDYHPVGTCKMGKDDRAVVSPELKVHGIEALRVCDSSVMPKEISANTNAPTIMVAEKAADIILGRPPLKRGLAA